MDQAHLKQIHIGILNLKLYNKIIFKYDNLNDILKKIALKFDTNHLLLMIEHICRVKME